MVLKKELNWRNYFKNTNLIQCKTSFNHFSDVDKFVLKNKKKSFVNLYDVFLNIIADEAYNYDKYQLRSESKNYENLLDESNELEFLVSDVVEMGKNIKIDIKEETDKIISYFLFEKERLGKNNIYSKDELNYQFNLIDESLASIVLKLTKDNPEKIDKLKPLLSASRKGYVLHDFPEDIIKGYVNFYREDLNKFKVDVNSIEDLKEISKEYYENKSKYEKELIGLKHYEFKKRARINEKIISNWYSWTSKVPYNISKMMISKAHVGLDELREYDKNKLHFKFDTRNAVEKLYVNSTRKCLERVGNV